MNNESNKTVKMQSIKFSEVPKGERVQFFLDYYLLKLIAIIAIIVTVIYIIVGIFSPRTEEVLNVAVFDESLNSATILNVENEVLNSLGISEENRKVTIDATYYSSMRGMDKLQVLVINGGVDVVIAPEEVFLGLAQYGYFDVIEGLPNASEGFYTRGFTEIEDGIGAAQGEEACYGIYLRESEFYKNLGGINEDAVIGILANSVNEENAYKFFDMYIK